ARGLDLLRGRQPAPRARVGGVRVGEAAGGQGRHSRRDRLGLHPRRAPAAGRATHRALRPAFRQGERGGRDRLPPRHLRRLVGGRAADRVAQAAGARRRRAHGIQEALGEITMKKLPLAAAALALTVGAAAAEPVTLRLAFPSTPNSVTWQQWYDPWNKKV